MELRCFEISVQSEAHQFWTLLMGLIQCCQHTIPFISFDLEAPMCNVETTYEDGRMFFDLTRAPRFQNIACAIL